LRDAQFALIEVKCTEHYMPVRKEKNDPTYPVLIGASDLE
jgi:hypothetical protein